VLGKDTNTGYILLRCLSRGESLAVDPLTFLGRKFIIPLMEYFDATKLTIRVGDCRVLRDRKGKYE